MKTDFDKECEIAKVQDVRISDLETKRRAMASKIQETVDERNELLEQANQFINLVKKDNESRYKSTQSTIKINIDKIKDLNKFRDESRQFEDSMIK